jgi:hypothetical protein
LKQAIAFLETTPSFWEVKSALTAERRKEDLWLPQSLTEQIDTNMILNDLSRFKPCAIAQEHTFGDQFRKVT